MTTPLQQDWRPRYLAEREWAEHMYEREFNIRRAMNFDNRGITLWRIAYYCVEFPKMGLRPYAVY